MSSETVANEKIRPAAASSIIRRIMGIDVFMIDDGKDDKNSCLFCQAANGLDPAAEIFNYFNQRALDSFSRLDVSSRAGVR